MDDLLFLTLALLGSIVSFLGRPLELAQWVHVKAAHAPLEPLPASLQRLSSARIAPVVSTSPSRGKIFVTEHSCAAGSRSVIASAASVTL
jgi:hypothetical protein